jgi:hypothetical protein
MKIYNEDKTTILWETKLDQEYMGYSNEYDWIEGEYGDEDLYDGKTIDEYKNHYVETKGYEKPDLSRGELKLDTLVTNYPEVEAVEEKGHYETIREYDNGGKDVKWVVDVKGIKYQPEREEVEHIYVYIAYTQEQILELQKEELRQTRDTECFLIINRGKLWYDTLTSEQTEELKEWYRAWLDVTKTLVEPTKPEWIK